MSTKSMTKRAPRRRNRKVRGPNAKPRVPRRAGVAGRLRRNPRRRIRRGRGGGMPLTKIQKTGGSQFATARGRKQMRITESEFIGAVTVANQPNFNSVVFAVNPGNATTFPWLSTIAKQFEKYKFERLNFVFKREVSEFATAGQTGKVIMSFDTDASDAPPATKQQMEDTDPHRDCMPCENMGLNLDPTMLHGPMMVAKFVRPAGLPGAADIKLYDVGNLNIATQGITANNEVGELHVNYTIVLEKPILENLAGAPANNSVSWFQSTTSQTYTTTIATTALDATATVNGLTVVNTAGSMVPPAGNYLVDFTGLFGDSAAEAFTAVMDFQKNAASVYTTTSNRPQFVSGVSLGAGENFYLTGSVFVSANGTDAFTQRVTLTGAAGVLTGGTSVRWTAM